MDAETLRELQEPLKAKYRSDPASAMVTLDTPAIQEQLETPGRLTERHCVIYQTLTEPPAPSFGLRRD